MKRVLPFKNGIIGPSSTILNANANVSPCSSKRIGNQDIDYDTANIYVTPSAPTLGISYLKDLVFAPRKKKSNVSKRRFSPFGSTGDCRHIRKRLDFENITVCKDITNNESNHASSFGKRKLSFGQTLTSQSNELAVPFSDLQVTPKTTKKFKSRVPEDHPMEVSENVPEVVCTPKPTCSKRIHFDIPSAPLSDPDQCIPLAQVDYDDEIDVGETPIMDPCYRNVSKNENNGDDSDNITPIINPAYRLLGKPDVIKTDDSSPSGFTKITDASKKKTRNLQKDLIINSRSARNLSLIWD